MQHLFKIFLFLIPFQIATAQQTVTIYGEIHNPGSGKVYIKYLENYLTNDKAYADSALIDQNGNFSMAFPWNKSFPAVFIYGDERTVMFLSPADSMKITVDAKQFYKTIKYENKGAEANNYLAQKSLLFPPQRGSVIFKFEEKVFTQLVDSLHNEEMKNFNEYFSKIKSQSPSVAAFMDYEEAEIKYNWASTKTSYAEAYEYYNHLTTPVVLADDFFHFTLPP